MRLARREVLQLLALQAAALSLGGCGRPQGLHQRVARVSNKLRRCFGDGDLDAVAEVGEIWLDVLSADRDEAELESALDSTLRKVEDLRRGAVSDALRDAIRGEHAALDTVDVDGWVLAPTEADLAALVALM